MTETLSLLFKQISNRIGVKKDDLTPDTTLESLGIDSLGKIELLFDLEDYLGMKLPDDRREINTIQDVADFIDSIKASQK
jgi:acyl carrier protein